MSDFTASRFVIVYCMKGELLWCTSISTFHYCAVVKCFEPKLHFCHTECSGNFSYFYFISHLVKEMTDLQKLEDLYNRKIKIDEEVQSFYQSLLRYMEHDLIIPEMKKTSIDFDNLYRNTYYGGSFFDGLKVYFCLIWQRNIVWLIQIGSSSQEFDLNILFKWNRNQCQIVKLGQDSKKKNFGYIMVTKPSLSESENKIVFNEGGIDYISPKKVLLHFYWI